MDKALVFNNRAKWGLALAAVPVVGIALYLISMFLVGLGIVASLGGAAVGALILLALTPAISERLTQLKYRSFKAAVAAFPEESLDINVARGAKHLKRAHDALLEKGAEVETFRQEVAAVERDHPEDVAEAREQLAAAEEQLQFYVADWVELERVHLAYVKEVARQKRRWRLAMAGKRMREALVMKDDFMAQMRNDAAFTAIAKAHGESIAHMKLTRDVNYMRQRIAAAAEKPQALVYDNNHRVVLPLVQEAMYVETEKAGE